MISITTKKKLIVPGSLRLIAVITLNNNSYCTLGKVPHAPHHDSAVGVPVQLETRPVSPASVNLYDRAFEILSQTALLLYPDGSDKGQPPYDV